MKKIIVAPLNWGLGHATRCIPLIKALIENKFTPIIASDGDALSFLKKEFPNLETLALPFYNIRYGRNLKMSLFWQIPKLLSAIKQEENVINNYLKTHKDVVGIISDNRLGVRSDTLPSVYLTHQLKVFSGWTTNLSTKIHQFFIKKFDECWIPDQKGSILSGELSSSKFKRIPVKYTGVLSRFTPEEEHSIKNDVLIVLSGPEPNRTSLENKLLKEFKNYKGSVVFVRGVINGNEKPSRQGTIKIYDYLLSEALQKELNQSRLVICRSGYSSVMDMAVLGKKAFFIPTKNQNEQEYLACYLEACRIASFASEARFTVDMLKSVNNYTGFQQIHSEFASDLLNLFERK